MTNQTNSAKSIGNAVFATSNPAVAKSNARTSSSVRTSLIGLRVLLAVGISVIAGMQLWHYVSWTPDQLTAVGLIIDDAFFYSVIARNFHEIGAITLDGTLPTNGFQPLWMVLQVGLTGLFPTADGLTLLMWASWTCYVLFSFLTIWYVARGPWVSMLLAATTATAMLLNSQFQRLVFKGLETTLMLLMVMITLHVIDFVARRQSTRSTSQQKWLAVPLAISAVLCFYTRTDLFWMVIVVGGWYMLRSKRPLTSAPNLIFWGIVVAMITPYLAYNAVTQGGLMPISGAVKLHYMQNFYPDLQSYLASDEWRGLITAFARMVPLPNNVAYVLAFPAVVIGTYVVWHFRSSLRFTTSIRLLTLAALAHIITMQLLYREVRNYTSYYFSFEILWLTLVGCLLVVQWSGTPVKIGQKRKLFMRRVLPISAACLAFLLAMYQWQTYRIELSDYWVQRINLAKDINQIVPEEERVGAFWPGTLAHFSERHIVPLDGIVSSRDYFESYVIPGREMAYLRENNITYVAIFLQEPLWKLMNHDSLPEIDDWSAIGVQRLWQTRDVPMDVLTARRIADSESGWYLLKLDFDSAEGAAPSAN